MRLTKSQISAALQCNDKVNTALHFVSGRVLQALEDQDFFSEENVTACDFDYMAGYYIPSWGHDVCELVAALDLHQVVREFTAVEREWAIYDQFAALIYTQLCKPVMQATGCNGDQALVAFNEAYERCSKMFDGGAMLSIIYACNALDCEDTELESLDDLEFAAFKGMQALVEKQALYLKCVGRFN